MSAAAITIALFFGLLCASIPLLIALFMRDYAAYQEGQNRLYDELDRLRALERRLRR